MSLFEPVDRIAGMSSLDRAVGALAKRVDGLPRGLRDALHGTWLGHPVHPVLAYVPVGAWLSSAILDAAAFTDPDDDRRAGYEQASQFLVGAGLAAAPLAALAGAADWAEMHTDQQRIGVVHAAANTVALGLYGASLQARRSGHHGVGRLLGVAGVSVAGVSAGIGGHLSFRWGAGVHRDDVRYRTPRGWHHLGRIEEFPDGGLWQRHVGDTPVVVLRRRDSAVVLADVCGHCAGPLHEGTLVVEDGEDCVRCPWYGSTYRFRDGRVVTGPSTAPQPVFEVRLEGGQLSARIAPAPTVLPPGGDTNRAP